MDGPLCALLSFPGGLGVLEDGPRLIAEAGSVRSGDMRYWGGLALSNRLRYGSAAALSLLKRLETARAAERDARFHAARGRALRLLGMTPLAGESFEAALRIEPRCAWALAFRGESRTVSDPDGSRADLSAALEVEPGNPAFRLWLANALFASRRDAEASAALDDPPPAGPEGAGARLLRGLLARGAGDWAAAGREFSAGLESGGDFHGFLTLRAAVRWEAGDREGAVSDAHAALDLHPENFEGFIAILFSAHPPSRKGPLRNRVVESAGRFLAAEPGTPWALGVRGEFLGSGDTGYVGMKGFTDLYAAADGDPRRAWILAYLARGLGQDARAAGWRGEADAMMERAVEAAPRKPWLLAWRSQLHRRAGRDAPALSDLDESIRLDPSNPIAYAWRGKVRGILDDQNGAVQDLSRCIAVDIRPHFLHDRAAARWRAGRVLDSLSDLGESVARRTSYAMNYSGWPRAGFGREGAGWFRALRTMRRSAALGPPKPRFDPPGGWIGRVPVEAAALERELERRPDPRLRLWLGRARMDAGLMRSARPELAAAAAEPGTALLGSLWMGELLCRAGEAAEAVSFLDRALALQPEFPAAYLWRGLARRRLGRSRDAARDFFHAVLGYSCEDLAVSRHSGAKGSPVYRWIRAHLPGVWAPASGPGAASLLMSAVALVGGDGRRALAGAGPAAREKALPGLDEARRRDRELAALEGTRLAPRDSAAGFERCWRASHAARGGALLALGLDFKRGLDRADEREASRGLHAWCLALLHDLRLYR